MAETLNGSSVVTDNAEPEHKREIITEKEQILNASQGSDVRLNATTSTVEKETDKEDNSYQIYSSGNIRQGGGKDSGWAWIIMAGAFLHIFLFVGIGKSFGLFFVEFLTVYNTNSTLLSGILSIQNLVISLSSLIVLNIGRRVLGPRRLIIIGGFVACAAYILNAYAPGLAALIISQSILYGIGASCITGPVFIVINEYFDTKLGFATLFSSVGGSIGSLVMPIVIQLLLDEYGLQGALLIVSGLLLNNVIVGALTRPFTASRDTVTVKEKNKASENIVGEKNTDGKSTGKARIFSENIGGISISLDNIVKYQESGRNITKYYEPKRDVTNHFELVRNSGGINDHKSYTKLIPRRSQQRSLSESCSGKYGKTHTIITNPVKHFIIYRNASIGTKETMCSMLSLEASRHHGSSKSLSCRGFIDFSILKNRHFLLILFASLFVANGCGMIVIYLPPFAKDHGIPNDQIAVLVTIMGACDLVSKFCIAWISDSSIIRRSHILICCLGITGITTIFNQLYNDFATFAVYSVLYGLFGNVYFSLAPLIIREIVGAEKYPAALSVLIQIHCIAFTVVIPLLGIARDTTGSYTLTFYIMGTGILIGCAAMLCEPIFKRMENKRIETC